MKARTETRTAPNGARVEIATVTHEGRDFAALGSVVDEANGLIVGYINGLPGAYWLETWDGETLAPLTLVRRWRQRGFGGVKVEIWAWRATVNGRTYTGRNSGPVMLVRMRAKA